LSIGVAVVGYGTWGPNHVRNLGAIPRCRLLWVCDSSPEALSRLQAGHGSAPRATARLEEVLADDRVRGVIVSTPAASHEALASACLEAGKHVLVEKPLSDDLEGALRLERLAARVGGRLQVGHLCVHHPGVQRVRRLIADGELGELTALDADRTSKPPRHPGVSVLWDLGVHDLSILDSWVGSGPLQAAALGASPEPGAPADLVHATLIYPGGVLASLRVSWRGPVKVRRCGATGTRAVAVFDDLRGAESVTLDAGDGPRVLDDLEVGEPLRRELEHFLDSLEAPLPSPTDGAAGVDVVRTLTALEQSMGEGGRLVDV